MCSRQICMCVSVYARSCHAIQPYKEPFLFIVPNEYEEHFPKTKRFLAERIFPKPKNLLLLLGSVSTAPRYKGSLVSK